LTPGAESGTWMRVDVWKLKLKMTGMHITPENMVFTAQRWRAYTTVLQRWIDETVTLV
jgi:hypothetical protein